MSADESQLAHRPPKKLKLVLKTSPLSTPVDPRSQGGVTPKDGSTSPPRPSYSPVTPTFPYDKLLGQQEDTEHQRKHQAPFLIDEPPPLPLNIEENPDAIALRATLSLLQLQRQQSLKDIRELDKIKDAALDDPHGFVEDLQAGKLKKPMLSEVVLDDMEHDTEDEDEDHESFRTKELASKFGQLPNAQNIARCPPIEWSKYHIVGQPLDNLHEMQKRYPGVSANDFASRGAREHEITAPYRPFKDELDAKKVSKRRIA